MQTPRSLPNTAPSSPPWQIPPSIVLGKLINMHRLDNAILIVQTRALNRHPPDGLIIVPPAPHDIGIEAAIRMRQLDVPLA